MSQSQTSEPLEQIMSCLQTLSSNMQSMSTEVRSISSRLERVEERQEEESETSNPVSAGPARRASTDPSFSTPLESRVSSGLSWAETMEQEETSNPDGSMEVEEAAGEEPSTGGIKLFTLADKADAFIRPACRSPLPNSTTCRRHSLNVLVSLVYHARQPHTWTKSSGQGYLPPSGQGIMSWRRFKLCPSTACFRSVVC